MKPNKPTWAKGKSDPCGGGRADCPYQGVFQHNQECEDCNQAYFKEMDEAYKRAHTCTICKKNWVDSEAGFDTCQECLGKA